MGNWKAAFAAPLMLAVLMAPAHAGGNLDRFKPNPYPSAPKPGPDFTKPMPIPTPPPPPVVILPVPTPGGGAIIGGQVNGTGGIITHQPHGGGYTTNGGQISTPGGTNFGGSVTTDPSGRPIGGSITFGGTFR